MARIKKNQFSEKVARADDAFGSKNYAEYTVTLEPTGKLRTKRNLFRLGYAFVFVLILCIVFLLNSLTDGLGIIFLPMFALAPMSFWILFHFTWPLVCIDYMYTIDHSRFEANIIHGDKKGKKPLFECAVKEFSLIAPLSNPEYSLKLKMYDKAEIIDLRSKENADDVYFAIHEGENGKTTIVYFEATSQALGAFKYYNKAATVMSETKR